MRILFITAFPPNKKTAGQNYSRQLINDLIKWHKVDVIYWEYPGHEIEISNDVKILKEFQIKGISRRLIYIFRHFPLFSKRYSKAIADYIASIAGMYDIVYFDFSQVFMYSLDLDHPLKIGMSHDIIAQKFSRHRLFKFLIPWVKNTEQKCIKSLNAVYTFSKKDSNYIKINYGIVAGIVPFYLESQILNLEFDKIKIQNYYVMYGAWNRKENQETIIWVLSYNWTDMPQIKIIGGGMPSDLKNKLSQYPNIEYCGFVENPYPIIASSKGLLAPLFHGAGVKVKVIESLALGTPVIGTDITFEGIDNISFRNIGALINLNNSNLEQSIETLNTITVLEKKSIREQFLSIYNSTKFIDHIESLKTNL